MYFAGFLLLLPLSTLKNGSPVGLSAITTKLSITESAALSEEKSALGFLEALKINFPLPDATIFTID